MLGYLLLFHCIYSAHEYNQLPVEYNKSDLFLELAVSLVLIFFSAIKSIKNKDTLTMSNKLIRFNDYLKPIQINESLKEYEDLEIENFNFSYRKEFIDIVKMRNDNKL